MLFSGGGEFYGFHCGAIVADSVDNLSSLESELLSVTLQRYNDSIASTLTPSCGKIMWLIHAVKSQQCTSNTNQKVAFTAVKQVKKNTTYI